jgi:protein-tyrosine phosphatase
MTDAHPPIDAGAAPDRLAGAPNFRAVAVLPAADGRRLRPMSVFRSDALHRLTADDVTRLARLRIDTVLDLRRDDERAAAPSRWPATAVPDTKVFDTMPDLQAVRAGGWRVMLANPDFDAGHAHRWMLETYTRMPAALAPAVRAAVVRFTDTPGAGASADTAAPLLVHCTAGKDRTGFVVAMLLDGLGVPRDAIIEDYLESGRRRPPEALAHALVAMAGLPPTQALLAAVETIASVRTEFLEAALDAVAREHGSIDAYLAACGLDPRARDTLRTRLLD